MTTKQAIKTALRDTNKFIIGDYNGQKWYCPQGSFATIDNIYAQYKPLKKQLDLVHAFDHVDKQPKMESIIDNPNSIYELVESTVPSPDNTILVNKSTTALVNTDYFQLMQVLYPSATYWLDKHYSYGPIKVMVKDYINGGNKLVAMIMPLHK